MNTWDRKTSGAQLVLRGLVPAFLIFWGMCAMKARAAPKPKKLNNFVTQLLKVSPSRARSGGGYAFMNPRDGWVFFRSTAKLDRGQAAEITFASPTAEATGRAIIRHTPGKPDTLEGMRRLPRGKQRIYVVGSGGANVTSLEVRAIPEILYANYPGNPQLTAYGKYDWDFLKRIGMLDSCNVLITGGDGGEFAARWRAAGKRVIQQAGVPGLHTKQFVIPQIAYDYWIKKAGLNSPNLSGVIADEFFPSLSTFYPAWVAAIQQIRKEKPDRVFYPYIAGGPRGLMAFVKPLVESGCVFAYERYLKEQPTEKGARRFIEQKYKKDLIRFKKYLPDFQKRLIFVLGFLCGPPETVNTNPATSYKVYTDMQMHLIATDREFDGIYGVEEYLCSYCDEEYLRWCAKLFRHYCIEGSKKRLSNDPYELKHIRNPDFESGTSGWTVSRAESGSVRVRKMSGYGWLQGRYPKDAQGDTFLWMRRSRKKPNLISQEIRDLTPGRYYSLKMYTGDYQELTKRQKHVVSVNTSGVEMIPEQSFQDVFKNCYSHLIRKYGKKDTYFNWHRLVFRAKSPTAELTISDWESERKRGGPAGQELMLNFIEIEPFLMPDAFEE